MSRIQRDSHFVISGTIILLVIIFPYFLRANTDTTSINYTAWFDSNIADLNDLCNSDNLIYYPGEFQFSKEINFEDELQKSNALFAVDLGADEFFTYLLELPVSDKQNLVRYFALFDTYFENELKAADLPGELKYLAPAISAMNPYAISANKDAGLWQLNHFQGILNGLEITLLVDGRFNVQLSTKAAVNQLKQNVQLFENTELAVIAFLTGNTKLRNTLESLGEFQSLTEVLDLLPVNVTKTIAAYQALSVFLKTNSFAVTEELYKPDTVAVNRQMHFWQIAQVINIPVKQLELLNPQFRYSIIPGDGVNRKVLLPNGKRNEFLMLLDSVYNAYDSSLFQVVAQNIEYPPAPNRQYVGEKVKDLEIEGKTKIRYTIKSGDVLGFIAEDYDVRVADLKYWNNIYNERRIQAGHKLDIFVDDDKAEYYSGLQKKSQPKSQNYASQISGSSPIATYAIPLNAKKVEHTVKSGESPYVIAKKYEGVTPEEILEWNGIEDARKIQIGQKLIIYLE